MTRSNIFPLIVMIMIAALPVLSIHMPRALSFLPILFGLCASLWWVFVRGRKLYHSKFYIYAILGICALCIISTLWSIAPMEALQKALKISAILLLSIPLLSVSFSIRTECLTPYLWLFPTGVTIAALLCSFELAFDLPLYQMLRDLDATYEVNMAVMNRGAVCTVLAYFPALLFIHRIDGAPKLKYALIAAMSGSVILMLLLTQSQSGQLAFMLGLLCFFLFPHNVKYTHKMLAVLIIGALLLTPLIVQLLFTALIDTGQTIPWLKDGYAGNRVEIWRFVMDYALGNPLYGYGIEATRFVTEFKHDYIYHKDATTLHPHNFSIQLWIEFGVIGVMLASAFIFLVMRKISQLDLFERRTALCAFIAVTAISSVGYGMWQSWWLGELIFITALYVIVIDKKRGDL